MDGFSLFTWCKMINEHGVPEENLVIRMDRGIISAKPYINAIRHIRDKMMWVDVGISELTPSDKFVMQMIRTSVYEWQDSGTHTTLPNDVVEFITSVYNSSNSSVQNNRSS